MSLWVGELVSFWVGEFVSLWVGEFVSLWVDELISSAVVGVSWVYKPVSWLAVHSSLFVEILKDKTTSMSSISTSPLYWHNKAPCTGITRGLYGGYKILVVRLQKACSHSTKGLVQISRRKKRYWQTTFQMPFALKIRWQRTLIIHYKYV